MVLLKIKDFCAWFFYLAQSLMLFFGVAVIKLRGKNKFEFGRATKREELFAFLEAIRPFEFNGSLIRVGSKGDGGYLMPQDCFNAKACFSPGVDVTADFELEFASEGVPCFLADFSVASPPINHPLFKFKKKFIGNPINQNFIRFDDWVDSCVKDARRLVLQMDVEGHEFDAINQVDSEFLKRFQALSIEFHSMDHLIYRKTFENISVVFNKLLEGHFVAHIHANNNTSPFVAHRRIIPRVFEITFLSRLGYERSSQFTELPNKLDAKCNVKNPDIDINKMWP